MIEVTMYKADDGSTWPNPAAALVRDSEIVVCQEAVRALGMRQRPDDIRYDSGGGYVQQPAGTKRRLEDYLELRKVTRDQEGPLRTLLHRYMCLDEQDREWGQPYFAAHPDKAKGEGEEWQGGGNEP